MTFFKANIVFYPGTRVLTCFFLHISLTNAAINPSQNINSTNTTTRIDPMMVLDKIASQQQHQPPYQQTRLSSATIVVATTTTVTTINWCSLVDAIADIVVR
jgi:hypothetical protein